MKMLDALLGAFSFEPYQKALRQRRERRAGDIGPTVAERDETTRESSRRQSPGEG